MLKGTRLPNKSILPAITCRVSEYYPNGEVKNPKLSYGIGEELHLTCDPGYVMDGPSALTCLGTLTSSNLLGFTYAIDLYNLRALGRISQAEA